MFCFFLKNTVSSKISISFLTGKNEVTLEFHQHDDAEVSLMEMRFYVPPNNDGTDADPVKVRDNLTCKTHLC